jgi:arylsulfatase B
LITAWLLVLACGDTGGSDTSDSSDAVPPPLDGPPENVLIVLLDDVGVDKVTAYGEHPDTPNTPTLDRLATDGLLFRSAYANPTCSPTRGSVLTGRHPARTGVGRWLAPWDYAWDLQDEERTLAEVLADGPGRYDTALAGKWHLVSFQRDDPAMHPLTQGFRTHQGSLANLKMATDDEDETERGYTYWEKSSDGQTHWEQDYATTDTVDDAVALLDTLEPPWLLYVSLNAPHIPAHEPPGDLLAEPLGDDPSHPELYAAMLEAADTELGRLLDHLSDAQLETTSIFVAGDNGTPEDAITEPFDASREKGGVYENGVRVPLFALGPHVATPGGETDALVQLTDLFSTAAELGGVPPDSLDVDGLSLLPILADPAARTREIVFTEGFYPPGEPPYETHDRMVRDATHKLIWKEADGVRTREFFRFEPDAVDEGQDLLAQGPLGDDDQAACDRLEQAMITTVADLELGQ